MKAVTHDVKPISNLKNGCNKLTDLFRFVSPRERGNSMRSGIRAIFLEI
jgi:hypothetical protein